MGICFSDDAHCSGEKQYLGTKTLYHATDSSGYTGIMRQGMRPGSSGAYGGGMYFADNVRDAQHKARTNGTHVVTAKVDLGKALVARSTGNWNKWKLGMKGCKSVYAPRGPRGGGSEYVAYDPKQVQVVGAGAQSSNHSPRSPRDGTQACTRGGRSRSSAEDPYFGLDAATRRYLRAEHEKEETTRKIDRIIEDIERQDELTNEYCAHRTGVRFYG